MKMRYYPPILTGHEKRGLPNKHGKVKTIDDLKMIIVTNLIQILIGIAQTRF